MAKVYNWQLGREMDYPYEAKYPALQFAAIFNTNRCIGCHTCSMACKSTWTFSDGQEYMWWNNIETKPYGGYPQFWDMKILKLLDSAHVSQEKEMTWNTDKKDVKKAPYGQYDGMTIFEAVQHEKPEEGQSRVLGYLPQDHEWSKPNIHEDASPINTKEHDAMGFAKEGVKLPVHDSFFFYLQRICNHCQYPACLAACPRKAIYKRPEDGVVLIDQERCRGYRKCNEACPYKKPMYNGKTKASEKCIACYPRLEGKDNIISPEGVPVETRCMSACVGKIRLQGLVKLDSNGLWEKDSSNPLYALIHEEKIALPLYPQFGTEPNMYYIPPRWAPRNYLMQMFGPGVQQSIDNYTYPTRRTLAILQLFRAQREIIYKFETKEGPKIYEREVTLSDGTKKMLEVFDDTAIGYNKNGKECVRVTVQEPAFERSAKFLNSI
ncbi:MAG: nitrate oxidoreductase subunit beta [Bacteroidetes bacterium RIFCSPLOWO2_02_FULL_36_8]|nr:MAG: nitrate oxidoreductase subunit beta [Bacteroidetes bacterium RIFCSPLOWO2_02_FULL_36_8]OFY68889.1 MAG: nitrate oxidoreductase subunit beta [Bacteroidetes bacterium RIFCSPLOWO2_12_FULL_37_12]